MQCVWQVIPAACLQSTIFEGLISVLSTPMFSKKYITLLTHILAWLLMAFAIIVYGPLSLSVDYPSAYYVKQTFLLLFLIGLFYLNAGVLVRRFFAEGPAFTVYLNAYWYYPGSDTAKQSL